MMLEWTDWVGCAPSASSGVGEGCGSLVPAVPPGWKADAVYLEEEGMLVLSGGWSEAWCGAGVFLLQEKGRELGRSSQENG